AQSARCRRLQRGTVGNRIGERQADLDDVGSLAVDRAEQLLGGGDRRVASHRVADERGAPAREGVRKPAHRAFPSALTMVPRSLSPRPLRFTTTAAEADSRSGAGSFGRAAIACADSRAQRIPSLLPRARKPSTA